MSFADSFWSNDYELGFKILFDQLYQGILENDDFVLLFNKRMELELMYGTQLASIEKLVVRSSSKRQANDDYVSSIKNAYQKINENFGRQGDQHLQVATNIRLLVVAPFTKWCKEHKQRIEYSESVVFDKSKHFRNSKLQLERIQKRYFNKCRMLEEFKSHYTEDELNQELKDIEFSKESEEPEEAEEEEEALIYNIGGAVYDSKTIKSLLTDILKTIGLRTHKVAILGTYHNVSTGTAITEWLLANIPQFNNSIAKAETFGQDLINEGLLRIIGSIGKTFINSSQFYYQWKPIVFELTGLQGTEDFELGSVDDSQRPTSVKPVLQDYFEDMKQAIGVNTVDYNDKSQLSKLIEEVNSLDSQYFQNTVDVDKLRCEFEELIMDHLSFMQKCELDRLKAVKKVTFDFLLSFSNKITSMKALCDQLLIIEETINPINDLKFLVENYATGNFKPNVILYDNYYNSNLNQTFGVDLNVKSRLDKKVVPIIVQCILSYLDKVYPDIENDDERINLWTQPIHLAQVHQLRFQLNDLNDPVAINNILTESEPLVVTNTLKLYFMELPDSIIPYNYYDLIKSLYSNYPINDESKTQSRITGLQNVLIDLPKCNLATLDSILAHLNRLIQIIGLKNPELAKTLQSRLSREFGNLILKPKFDPSIDTSRLLVKDKHQFSLINDLFEHKDTIFKELRRRNSTRKPESSSASVSRQTSSTISSKSSVLEKSRLRLEKKLQQVVKPSKAEREVEQEIINVDDEKDATPDVEEYSTPPASPKKPSLKRSTSPNKKKLSSLLLDDKKPVSKVVSSRPSKKDIVYSEDSGAIAEFGQPKFILPLGRKTSVKDLASQFDESSGGERSSSPQKGGYN